MGAFGAGGYAAVIDEIASLDWVELTATELSAIAYAYYFFSVQFRENLEIACWLYPGDPLLRRLEQEECNTANLSPWPGVAGPAELLNHDEFMRRLLRLTPIAPHLGRLVEKSGRAYLYRVRKFDAHARAASIVSYEDGGLERVFRAMLECRHWDTALLKAFKHFLVRHIAFDGDGDNGHGALVRQIGGAEGSLPLWLEFKKLLIESVPALCTKVQTM